MIMNYISPIRYIFIYCIVFIIIITIIIIAIATNVLPLGVPVEIEGHFEVED